MADIFRHGLLSNIKSSESRMQAIRLVLKELKSLKEEAQENPAMKDPETRRAMEVVIPLLISTFLVSGEASGEASKQDGPGKEISFPTKEEHFSRNQFMDPDSLPKTPEEAEKLGWDDSVASDCHQFTSAQKDNRKFVSPDGRSEVIFDDEGDAVTAPEDKGSYNYADPNTDPVGHFNKDVLPWLIWGNDVEDSTDMSARMRAFVIDGGIHAIKKKENQ